jgi:hypothetical protein
MAVTVKHNVTEIISGGRDKVSGIWHINMASPPPAVENVVYETHTLPQITDYLHVVCISPAQDTWINEIKKGHFVMWSGLALHRKMCAHTCPNQMPR